MVLRGAIVLWLTLTALLAAGQEPTTRVAELRNKAIAEGSVEVEVTTRAAVAAPIATRTQAQRAAIQLARQKILFDLIPKGLVVGSEIKLASDGSFTMRVLPDALDVLAASSEVARLARPGSATNQGAAP